MVVSALSEDVLLAVGRKEQLHFDFSQISPYHHYKLHKLSCSA